jgi:acetylornithine deacetylase/succinyl-diaminopimelate desuccinylase-like protein
MSLTQDLQKLIRFKPITNDRAATRRALSWLQAQFRALGLHTTTWSSAGYQTLQAWTHSRNRPALLLAAHVDVVPGPARLFRPVVRQGKLYGRGAYDMLFAIASYLEVLRQLRKKIPTLNLGVLITSDEEIGGDNGTAIAVKRGLKPKLVFLPDGGMNWNIELAAKGVWHFRATATGRAAHGAHLWDGDNAITMLTTFLTKILALVPKEPCGNKTHWHNSINVGTIAGGNATNSVPAVAVATVDVRFTTQIAGRQLKQKILKLARAAKIQLETISEGGAVAISRQHPAVLTYARVAKKHGVNISTERSHGASDAPYFADVKVPVLLVTPTGGNLHTDREWINLRAAETYTKILQDFILQAS